MEITVQFFAHLSDIAGGRTRKMDVINGSTVETLQSHLAGDDDRFAEAFVHCRVAVNNEWATAGTILSQGDDIAFVPPVSGG